MTAVATNRAGRRLGLAVLVVAFLLVLGAIGMYVLDPFGARTTDPRGRLVGIVPYRVASESMAPTLRTDQVVFVDARSPAARVVRGSVVTFRSPVDERGNVWLSRVVAVAGDRVAIADGVVTLNGAALVEPYADWTGHPRAMDPMDEILVPAGSVLTLGDNRGNSHDGRYWGPLALDRITGVVELPEK